ncbi:MAG: cation transporter [Aquificae bacterium]|nr:cation transporter [Aquificota bacterium]
MHREESLKVLLFSFVLILGFAFVELVAGILTNSLALLSDAGHMLTDAVSLFVALVAQYLALRVRSGSMTYGLYRLEVLAALLNGLFLLFLVGYIFLEAISRFENPEPVDGAMLYVAVAGLMVNLTVGYLLLRHSHENINVKAALLHVATDTLGSVAAIVAGLAVKFWQFYLADPILSVAVALLILPSAYGVIKETLRVLLEGAPAHINTQELERALRGVKGVKDLHDLHVWSITPGSEVLTVHLVVGNELPDDEVLKRVHEVARSFGIKHATVQLEREGFSCPRSCPLAEQAHHHRHHLH